MNERIKELAEQAGFDYTIRTGFIASPESNLAKFAELIVQEMHQVLKAEVIEFEQDHNFGAVQGVGRSLRKIREHFGVE